MEIDTNFVVKELSRKYKMIPTSLNQYVVVLDGRVVSSTATKKETGAKMSLTERLRWNFGGSRYYGLPASQRSKVIDIIKELYKSGRMKVVHIQDLIYPEDPIEIKPTEKDTLI